MVQQYSNRIDLKTTGQGLFDKYSFMWLNMVLEWWMETYIEQTYPVKTAQGAGQSSESHTNIETVQTNDPEIETRKSPRRGHVNTSIKGLQIKMSLEVGLENFKGLGTLYVFL